MKYQENKETYLLIAGGWQGAWCWKYLSKYLRNQGHSVHAISLPGMAEYFPKCNEQIDLQTHINAAVEYIDNHKLYDINLVGHSYGGMVISGVADIRANCVKSLVYLDALVPENNQSEADLFLDGASTSQGWYEQAKSAGTSYLLPLCSSPQFLGMTNKKMIRYLKKKATPHPIATLTSPINYVNGGYNSVSKKIYIECTKSSGVKELIRFNQERIKSSSGWIYQSINSSHQCMLEDPLLLGKTLTNLTCSTAGQNLN
ncbi:hypothetical protein PPL_06256 [Heterostelium album PN500]|uniref:AB hydrolase-1 domain-containing protein n=1 Tax=Heterostelium pallidum (strain ATCC 26659 / Pp 5 / PN500) TaxID=670386 RepID=D3BCN1_HETP5|nr:hypothetical protein PPL_06256 [Heterostelium album PN500]EFA80673.1 hypothetical protein PPL_06256 [Heterostelium album PN500]|eukprot:XP_020432793.1 hypothetical protein PPL_06256 [Heterostelium album PN500]